MNSFPGALPQRLRSDAARQWLYAAGVFALLCFALLSLIAPLRAADLFDAYGIVLSAVLFGVFLARWGLTSEACVRLYLFYLLWLLVSRWLNGDVYLFIDREQVYLNMLSFLFFSLGVVLSPEGRRRLLNVLTAVYAGFFVLFSLLGLFVAVTNTYIHVPPENVWITIRSSGNPLPLLNLLSSFRLVGAARLFLSWGLLGYQAARTRKTGLRILLVLGMLVLHTAIALCFSHTIWIALSLCYGMFVLLLGLRRLRIRSAVLRALLLAAVSVLAILASYKSLDFLLHHREALSAELAPRFAQRYEAWEHKPDPEYFGIAAPEQPAPVLELVRSTQEDLAQSGDIYLDPPRSYNQVLTLSWRTLIWESVFYCARKNPALLLRGQSGKTLMDTTNNYLFGVYRLPKQPNMHNSFLQVLMLTGLPGFLALVAWALLIIVRMVRVFFSRADTVPFSIAFLTIPLTGMFVFSMMESELFPAYDSSTKVFLMLAGIFLGMYRELFPKAGAPASE